MVRDERLSLLPRRSKLPRTGRLPKPDDPRDLPFGRYRTAATVAPPAHEAWGRNVPGYPMLLNDQLGDCGEAGALHGEQTVADNAGRVFTPTDSDALDLYEAVAGYRPGDPSTDNGTVLRELLKWWRANPVAANSSPILAFVAVNPTDLVEVRQAIATFGWVYVGVALTDDNYRTQGVRWHVTSGPGGQPDPNLGHCVIYDGYTATGGFKTVTWGQRGSITYACHKRICDEVWAVLTADWLNAAGQSPTNLDLAALRADLTALSA